MYNNPNIKHAEKMSIKGRGGEQMGRVEEGKCVGRQEGRC